MCACVCIIICTLQKRKLDIDFQSLITNLIDMIQATKDEDAMGRGLFYICRKVSLEIHLKHVHRRMCDIEIGKISVSVTTTTSRDDS